MGKGNTPQPKSILGGVLRMREHRILDFFIAGALTIGAILLGFSGVAYFLAFGLAVMHVSMTIFTGFTHRNMMPLRLHAFIEAFAAPVIIVFSTLPVFNSTKESMFFAVTGGLIAIFWLVSDYTEEEG